MKRHPVDAGNVAETAIIAALVKAGKRVAKPIGENQRYDLIIDNGDGSFSRVQCKAGRLRNGAVRFNSCSSVRKLRRSYVGEVDLFAVYCEEVDEVFLVPAGEVPLTQGCLRMTAPANNQMTGVRFAGQYRIQ